MVTADVEAELLRAEIRHAIKALRDQGVSQMDAYTLIGNSVGRSASWVRKHHGRNPFVGVRLRDFLNIRAAYDRLCTRIEDAAERIEAEAQTIERQSDAVRDRRPEAVARASAPAVRPRRRPDVQFRRVTRPAALMAA